MTGLYVYAIASRPVRLRARGIFGRPIRSRPVGGLHVLVEPASRAPRPSVARLESQSRVLDTFVNLGIDVLPVRFGTFVPKMTELEAALHGRIVELRKALRLVRGCVQMTLRVAPGHGRGRAVFPATPEKGTRAGTQYLRSRAARERSRRRDPAIRALAAAVDRLARASRIEWAESSVVVFHLVPRSKVGSYVTAITEAAPRAGAAVVLSGPFAPFAFAEVE